MSASHTTPSNWKQVRMVFDGAFDDQGNIDYIRVEYGNAAKEDIIRMLRFACEKVGIPLAEDPKPIKFRTMFP